MRFRKKLGMLGIASAGIFGLTGCGSALADSCEEFYEFDQEYASEIEQVMSTATSPDSSDEDKTDAQEFMQEARGDFEEVVAEAEDEEFLSSAEKVLPTYEIFEQLVEPGMTPQEQMELLQTGDMQSGLEAESQLIELCDAEIN